MTTPAKLVDDFKNLSGSLVALEGYRQILTGGHTLSQHAIAVMRLDLDSITSQLGLEQRVTLESFPSKPSNTTPTASQPSTLANVTDKIGQVVERLREILLELFEKAVNEIDALLSGVNNLQEKIRQTGEAVSNMPITTGREITVDAGMMSWLSTNGLFPEEHLTLLARLAKVGSTVYPGVVTDFYDDLTAAVKHYDPSTGAEQFIASIEASRRPLEFLNKDDTLYPGNQRLVMDDDGFSYSMAQDDDADTVTESQHLTIRSKVTLGKELVKIQAVLDELDEAREAGNAMRSSIGRLVEATKVLAKKAEAKNDPAAVVDAEKVIAAALTLARKTKPTNQSIIKYIGKQLQANLALMQLEARTAILKVSA